MNSFSTMNPISFLKAGLNFRCEEQDICFQRHHRSHAKSLPTLLFVGKFSYALHTPVTSPPRATFPVNHQVR